MFRRVRFHLKYFELSYSIYELGIPCMNTTIRFVFMRETVPISYFHADEIFTRIFFSSRRETDNSKHHMRSKFLRQCRLMVHDVFAKKRDLLVLLFTDNLPV